MTELGAGPRLTQNLDWQVDETGDITSSFDSKELEKDLALFSIAALDQQVGRRESPETRGLITSIVRDVHNADPRVDTVINIDVRFISRNNEAEVISTVITDEGEQELVFELDT